MRVGKRVVCKLLHCKQMVVTCEALREKLAKLCIVQGDNILVDGLRTAFGSITNESKEHLATIQL